MPNFCFFSLRVSCWTSRLLKLLMQQAPTGCGAAAPIPTRNRPAKRVQHLAPATETGKLLCVFIIHTQTCSAACTSRGADLLKCKHQSRALCHTTAVAAICVALFRLRGKSISRQQIGIVNRAASTANPSSLGFFVARPRAWGQTEVSGLHFSFLRFTEAPRGANRTLGEERSPPTSYLCLYL